jgi:hypothetical protein
MPINSLDPQSQRPADPGARASTPGCRDQDLTRALTVIVDEAVNALPDILGASVMLHGGATVEVPACSDPVTAAVDTAQLTLCTGPSLDALDLGQEVWAPGLADDPRWSVLPDHPAWCEAVGSVLALPITPPAPCPAGVLTLYCSGTGDLDRMRSTGRVLTSSAATVLHLAWAARRAHARLTDMEQAMRSRAVIDQAIGMVMVQQGCSDQTAFLILRRTSQNRNVKLRDVCRDIVDRVSSAGAPGR